MAASLLMYAIALLVAAPLLLKLYSSYTSTTRPPSTNNKKLPPSPPTWPIIGNLHQLSPLIHRSFFSLAQRYGPDLMLLHLGTIPSLVASSAESAREILQTYDVIFADKPLTETFRKLSFNYKEITMAPYGEYWRQARKLLVAHCLTYKQVQSYSGIRDEETASTVAEVARLSARNEAVNFNDLLAQHTNNVSTRTGFGRKYNEGESSRKFKKAMDEYIREAARFRFEDTIPRFAWLDYVTGAAQKCDAAVKALDAFLETALDERLEKINSQGYQTNHEFGEPLIDVLLTDKKSTEVELNLDRDVIKALLADMYLAGTHTTSSTMQWAVAELLAHPNVLKKVQAEIRGIVKNKQHITDAEVDQMEYLKAVIMESSRLHPPAPLLSPRIATEDVNVMGFHVPKETRVYVNAWAVGRDPKVWDRPDEYMPERFIGDSTNYIKHDFKLINFGAGRRGCPGRVFALNVLEHVLASILCNFDLMLPDGMKKDDINLIETVGLSRPKFPVLAFAKPCA